MKSFLSKWREDKLCTGLNLAWQLTVFTSFWGSAFLSVSFPGIGELYPFRICLPITILLYILWNVREKRNPWKESGGLEKMCYCLIAIMIVYGTLSLLWAIDFTWSFRRLFNLCFDLAFFFLFINICKGKSAFRTTITTAAVALAVLCIAGIYEIFNGGIVNTAYDDFKRFALFNKVYQFPVVSYVNTNDYASAVAFVAAVMLLVWSKDYTSGKENLWFPLLVLPIVYFLVYSTSSRLATAVMWTFWVGVVLFFTIVNRKRLWIPVVILVICLSINLANQYRVIAPALEKYKQELNEYDEQIGNSSEENVVVDIAREDGQAPSEPVKPQLSIEDHTKIPINEEFVVVDPISGETSFNENASGGIRVRLLIHSLKCLIDSRGMGVGLGNTEQLAKLNHVTGESNIWSIHCFVARIVADYGIWVLIPLAAVGLWLIAAGGRTLMAGIKSRDKHKVSLALMYFIILITYPVLSTASSDAQDIIPMWFYLGAMVLFAKIQLKPCIECT